MSGPLDGVRVAYVPHSVDLAAPGDRRRFVWYAGSRGISFSTQPHPGSTDVVYLTPSCDISYWTRFRGPEKIVFELIDSYLATSRLSARSMLRGAAKWATGSTSRLVVDYQRGLEAMCRRADAVVCSTDEQRARMLPLCDNVHVILDDHSELATAVKTDHAAGDVLRLVWEGLPQNLAGFEHLAPVLAELAAERSVELSLVTDEKLARWMNRFGWRQTSELARLIPVPTRIHAWSSQTLVEQALASDLAVIPIRPGDPFAMGKPENKLLIFWRLGLPTLTSATPAYSRAMAAAGLDMTCSTPDDWALALRRYGSDPEARADASVRGRAYVESVHDEASLLARWDELFRSVLP